MNKVKTFKKNLQFHDPSFDNFFFDSKHFFICLFVRITVNDKIDINKFTAIYEPISFCL